MCNLELRHSKSSIFYDFKRDTVNKTCSLLTKASIFHSFFFRQWVPQISSLGQTGWPTCNKFCLMVLPCLLLTYLHFSSSIFSIHFLRNAWHNPWYLRKFVFIENLDEKSLKVKKELPWKTSRVVVTLASCHCL